jgi:hypothetical protein
MKDRIFQFAAVLAALALVLVACGDGTVEESPIASLPIADDGATPPAASGACLEGEPDCNDTGVIGEPQDLPLVVDEPTSVDGGGVVSGGMTVDGGLEVSEALAGDAAGIIAVQGYLVDSGSGAKLCEALAESFPPQCGGASIPVSGYEEMIDVPLNSNQNTTWTDERVTLFGEIIDGTFVVDPTVAG